ncbi:Fc.00g031000.m01.CDS01 [Cosmosporella sp. VM-42]
MGSLPEASHAVRVFIAGGCYAGLAAAANLLDLSNGLKPRMSDGNYTHNPDLPRFDVDITIVDERDGYYHLIGSPLAFADSDYANKNWVKFTDMPYLQLPNVKIIQGSVAGVNAGAKTATISHHLTKEETTHEYDFFVAATGLRRVFPVVPQSLTRKQYLLEAEAQIKACENAKHGVVVVGGGAVGIEMAAELKMVKPQTKVTLVHSRDKLLSSEGLPDETKDVALELLKEGGVEVLLNHRLATTTQLETTDGSNKQEIEFTNGHKLIASEVVMAISRSIPTTSYLPHKAIDPEGYVYIRPNLNFAEGTPNADSHFAAGDITKWSGIKRCGAAMHQGHYAAMNLYQRLVEQRTGQKPAFHELNEVPPMIGLAVGKKAVAYGPDAGTIAGEDVAHAYFRDDLGWGICWNWIGFGPRKEQPKA